MRETVVYTNNPDVAAVYPAVYHSGGVLGVLTAVRDAVHQGARLISHPLSGVKPNESPCKSVVLAAPRGGLDYESLHIIEDALDVLRRLRPKHRCGEAALGDYRLIDLELVRNAMEGREYGNI